MMTAPIIAATEFPSTASEHVGQIVEGMSAGQAVSMLLLGGIFALLVLTLVWKIMDFRLAPLKDVPQTLIDIRLALGKMWSHEQLNTHIDNRVNAAIQEHEREYHKCTHGLDGSQKQQ